MLCISNTFFGQHLFSQQSITLVSKEGIGYRLFLASAEHSALISRKITQTISGRVQDFFHHEDSDNKNFIFAFERFTKKELKLLVDNLNTIHTFNTFSDLVKEKGIAHYLSTNLAKKVHIKVLSPHQLLSFIAGSFHLDAPILIQAGIMALAHSLHQFEDSANHDKKLLSQFLTLPSESHIKASDKILARIPEHMANNSLEQLLLIDYLFTKRNGIEPGPLLAFGNTLLTSPNGAPGMQLIANALSTLLCTKSLTASALQGLAQCISACLWRLIVNFNLNKEASHWQQQAYAYQLAIPVTLGEGFAPVFSTFDRNNQQLLDERFNIKIENRTAKLKQLNHMIVAFFFGLEWYLNGVLYTDVQNSIGGLITPGYTSQEITDIPVIGIGWHLLIVLIYYYNQDSFLRMPAWFNNTVDQFYEKYLVDNDKNYQAHED